MVIIMIIIDIEYFEIQKDTTLSLTSPSQGLKVTWAEKSQITRRLAQFYLSNILRKIVHNIIALCAISAQNLKPKKRSTTPEQPVQLQRWRFSRGQVSSPWEVATC